MKVEFYKHNLGEDEEKSVLETLRSVFLTTGPKTEAFEKALADYLRCSFGVGVSSWTMGGLIALKALGIGLGDEVITTPLTFISTANVILYTGATPIFVDVESETGNIDVSLIERAITPRTKAIMPVHLYGQMCDMRTIKDIADRHQLLILEDCAHCIEGQRDGLRPGQISTAAIFSFYATKNITSGEGGAIVINDEDLYHTLRKYRLNGMSKNAAQRYTSFYQHWDMEVLGYKCNMSDIQAALLIPQLARIEEILAQKEVICQTYQRAFAPIPGVNFPQTLNNSRHARHLFTIWVNPEKRDDILHGLQSDGIGVAVNFRAIHLLKYYRETFGFTPGMFPHAERIGNSTITLPMYPKLTQQEIQYVIDKVKFYTA